MATTTTTRKAAPKAASSSKLDKRVFGVIPTDHTLLHEAYEMYLANGRVNLATTKTRADVSGGGRKPWRQKGTGRARIGSTRAPHWRHGGVAFGPTGSENYSKHLNAKAKRLALQQALSLAAKAGKVQVTDAFDFKGGTVAKTLKLLKDTNASGKVLVVVSAKNELIDRATRNIERVGVISAAYLNVFNVMNADTVVFDQQSLERTVQRLAGEAKEAK